MLTDGDAVLGVPVVGWVCSVCGHIWAFDMATCTCGYAPEWTETRTAEGDDGLQGQE